MPPCSCPIRKNLLVVTVPISCTLRKRSGGFVSSLIQVCGAAGKSAFFKKWSPAQRSNAVDNWHKILSLFINDGPANSSKKNRVKSW
jgi:hypothetical protein